MINEDKILHESSSMRRAFTMIELLFVIVVLGLLVAVALPKLAATRDDAKASALAAAVTNGVTEVANYATANLQIESNLSKMSNAFEALERKGAAVTVPSQKKIVIKAGSVSNCLTVQVISGVNEENLTVTLGNAGSDVICRGVQEYLPANKFPMILRGHYVNH